MPYYAAIKDKNLQLFYESGGQLQKQNMQVLGSQLVDCLYYDPDYISGLLMKVVIATASRSSEETERFVGGVFYQNIYLHSLCSKLAEFLLAGILKTPAVYNAFCEEYARELQMLFESGHDVHNNIETLVKVFGVVFDGMRNFLNVHLDFCLNSIEKPAYGDIDPAARLYLYERWRRSKGEQPVYFDGDMYPVRLMTEREVTLPAGETLERWAEVIAEQKLEILEAAVLVDINAVMRFELEKLIMCGVRVKRCTNCGKYFVPSGRSDAEYCQRSVDGLVNRTCQSIGAIAKHQEKSRQDPVYREYKRAYKRLNSRVRTGTLSKEDFLQWSAEAQEKRDFCMEGKLTPEEFFSWLNQDRIYKSKT